MASAVRTRIARVLFSVRGFHVALALYLLVLFALKAYLFPGSSEDDAEQLFYAQALSWGYKPTQPPLYTWLVLASQQILGVGVPAVALVKFATMYLLYALMYRAADLVLADRRLALLAALSVLGIYYMAWDSVLNFSHTVLVAAMCVFTLYALLRLEHRDRPVDYGLLGLAIGLGLISKYNFSLFLIPLAVASLAQGELRKKLLSAKGLLAIMVAAVIAGPHFVWALTDPGGFAAVSFKNLVTPDRQARSYLAGVSDGLLDTAKGFVNFVSPLLFLCILFFPRAFRPLGETATASVRHRRLFEVQFVCFAVLVVLGVVLFRFTEIRNHWMVVLIPFPIYLMARVEAAAPPPRVVERFAGLLGLCAVAVVCVVVVRFVTAPRYCHKCNFFMPYADLAARLREAGFTGGTIVSYDYPNQIGGNLRAQFPGSRVVSWRFRPFKAPRRGSDGACLIIWPPGLPFPHRAEPDVRELAIRMLGARLAPDEPVRYVVAPIARSGGRTVRFAYMLLKKDRGDCR